MTRLYVFFIFALTLTTMACADSSLDKPVADKPVEPSDNSTTPVLVKGANDQETLSKSLEIWKHLKKANNGEYGYSRSFRSWVGFGYTTHFTIKDDIVIKREYTEFVGRHALEKLPESWIEVGADVGTHKKGHDALLIEQLYNICTKEVLTKDRSHHSIFLELHPNGIISNCYYVPKDCMDDCSQGVEIENLTFGK